jgi:hypothetical protein
MRPSDFKGLTAWGLASVQQHEHAWLIIETGTLLFWTPAGFLLFARFIYRFVTRSPG